MAKKIREAFSGKFYPLIGLLLAMVLIAGFFILKPRTSFGSSVSDTYSDTSKINTGASSKYFVSNGQLRMLFNSGVDGSITLAANKNINTDILAAGRSYADGVNAAVLSLGTNTIVVAGTFNGLAANDEVLLINLQGDSTHYGNVGKYEFLHVQSVTQTTNTTITLTTDIANIYGATNSNADLTGQKVMVQRVPNYTNVTINGGVSFYPSSWNGTIGGVIAFRASGTVSDAGSIVAWARGYRAGAPGAYSAGGDGESFCGVEMSGICGGGKGATVPSGLGCNTGEAGSNTGGSGGGGGMDNAPGCDDCSYLWGLGGGGGYGTYGSTNTSNGAANGGSGVSGGGGQGCNSGPVNARSSNGGHGGGGGTYGSADLSTLFFGTGGGATGSDYGASGVAGGAGGGIVFVHAATLNVSGTINSGGQNIANGSCTPGYAAGGGNGAGGSVLLLGQSATLGSALVTAPGGANTVCNAPGGDGRIAIGITSYTGTTSPTFTGTSVPSDTATVVSTNILQGQTVNAISSFDYTLSDKPTGSSATIQFSQNGTNWYNSSGTLNGTNTLSAGANNISLSALNWSGANFYYKIVFSGTASPVMDDVKLNFVIPLEAPTIGTPTALSTSSIRWAFTDNSTDEVAFKVFDNAGVWKFTCAGSNLTYCDETGLAAGTSYTRKVAASSNTNNDGTGVGLFSGTATKSTLSAVPLMPTVVSLSSSSVNVTVVPGPGAPTSDTYAIYFTTGSTPCNGSGGSYLQANGTLGAPAVYQSDVTAHGTPAWNTITVTGLNLDANNYNICAQDKNVGGQTTAWGPANSCNGGWMSISGYTYTGSNSSCSLTNSKLHDGGHANKYIFGVDNGAGSNANTAILKVASGAVLTVNSSDTLVAGSIQVDGEIALSPKGGQIKPGGKLYVVDGDSDNYPKGDPNATTFPALYYVSKTGDSPPTHNRRRTAIPTMAVTPDCNDFGTNAGQVHIPHAACYADLDSDTYTTGLMAGGNATCLSAATCAASQYYSASTDTNATNTAANTMRDAANGSDCNDANGAIFRSVNGYLDADSDTYGTGTLQTCVGATGNYTANNASDCYDNNPNVFPKAPGTGYCGTAYRGQTSQGALVTDNTAAGNSYIFNCNNGAPVFCGTAYTYSRTGVSTCVSTNRACGCLGSVPIYPTAAQTCGGALAICTNIRTWCTGSCDCLSGSGCDTITNGTQGCY